MRGDQDFRYDKDRKTLIPARTGYYWALWTKAANGTHEGDDLTPAVRWELVQVNDNNVDDPEDDEYLSVSVPGVRETQWRENFKWGLRVCDLAEGDKKPFSTNAQLAVDATRQELADRLEKYARDVSNSNHGGDQHTCDCDEAARLLRANTAQSADWRPMSSAPKDHSSILLLLKNPLPEQRNDLKHWIGLQFVGRHPGVCEDGFDIGWSFAAPVGHGGFPDDWFVGWMPLPASTQIGSQEVSEGKKRSMLAVETDREDGIS